MPRPGTTELASRRRFITLALAASAPTLAFPSFASSAGGLSLRPCRTVALDLTITETLLGIGHPPVGSADGRAYNSLDPTLSMPRTVTDVGLASSPNPEAIAHLNPDVILANPTYGYAAEFGQIATIAPIVPIPIYSSAGKPLDLAMTAVQTLANIVGDPDSASSVLRDAEVAFEMYRSALRPYAGQRFYVIQFIDGRHVTVFGRASLLQGVLDRLGLENAWSGASNEWGVAFVGLEDLAAVSDAWLAYVLPVPLDAERTLFGSPFWSRLPAVRLSRVFPIPPANVYGALPSAVKLAGLISGAIKQMAPS